MGKAGLSARRWSVASVVLASVACLAACAIEPAGQFGSVGGLPKVSIDTTPLAIAPPYVQLANDTCGANDIGWLVGRPKTEIPIPADLSHRRVTCTTCPLDGDRRPDRLNILYDARTGRVARLSCR